MPLEEKARSSQPFLEALHSEINSGSENLSEWINRIQGKGGIENLFGLETWLKGIRSFFNYENLPIAETEKKQILTRSFAPEIGIVHQTLQTCERYACSVLKSESGGTIEFNEFIEDQMRRHQMLDFNVRRISDQLTPSESVSQLIEFLNDLRITIDALKSPAEMDYQLFISLGRCFTRELKSCRYVDMLISQRFRSQYDSIDNKALSTTIRKASGESRKNVTLTLLFLFRFLKYLKLVAIDLKMDKPLRHHLVLFTLLNEEMRNLSDFIRARFLRNREIGHTLYNAAELIAFSLKMEAQRVFERELVTIADEQSPATIYIKIENSHGLMRNCFQSCILALVQSIDSTFDSSSLFPSRPGELVAAEKLRQDLWDMRKWLKDGLANKEELNPTRIIERIISFKESSMKSLMYRDWSEFEAFLDALAVSGNFMELRTHIRKFTDFLENLIQEVSKRSIFNKPN
jgi:hypothetical protein